MATRTKPKEIQRALELRLPAELRTEDGFERWFEPLKRRVQVATQEVEDHVRELLDAQTRGIRTSEGCERAVYEVFKGGGSLTKSVAGIRSKLARQLGDGKCHPAVLSPAQVKNKLLGFSDLGRFRVVFSLSCDVEQGLHVLLGVGQRRLAARYPVVVKVRDYVEDLSLRSPASGHRARQFAVAVPTGRGAETVRVEIQLMTTVQHAWDQRNHPIYEWRREGTVLPDHLLIRDVALAETLYLVDEQASLNWKDILEYRRRNP